MEHYSPKSTKRDRVLVAAVVTGLLLVTGCDAQCYGVFVSNAAYETQINGYYYLTDVLCNGYHTWIQQYINNDQPTNIISFAAETTYSNETGFINQPQWVVGPSVCKAIMNTLARNVLSGVTSYQQLYPYSLPNPWQEWYPGNSTYINNYSLTVTCSNELSGWAIFGIVIGCMVGTAIIGSVIICICVSLNQKKRRTQRPTTGFQPSPPPPCSTVYAVDSTGYSYVYTSSLQGGAEAAAAGQWQRAAGVGYPPQAAMATPAGGQIISPPIYDSVYDSVPPAYVTAEEYKNVSRQLAGAGVTEGQPAPPRY